MKSKTTWASFPSRENPNPILGYVHCEPKARGLGWLKALLVGTIGGPLLFGLGRGRQYLHVIAITFRVGSPILLFVRNSE